MGYSCLGNWANVSPLQSLLRTNVSYDAVSRTLPFSHQVVEPRQTSLHNLFQVDIKCGAISACDDIYILFLHYYSRAPKVRDTHRRVRSKGGNCLVSTSLSYDRRSWSPLVRELPSRQESTEHGPGVTPIPFKPWNAARPLHSSYFQLVPDRLRSPASAPRSMLDAEL
jgi:hypothetical protein